MFNCEKCGSENVKVVSQEEHLKECNISLSQETYYVLNLKCNNCGHEFKEGI